MMEARMELNAQQKHVLVLGAAGYIGRFVCRELAEQGCYVIGLGHGAWPKNEWQEWGLAEWIEADITLESLQNLSLQERLVAVIHCGGSGSVAYAYNNPNDDFERSTQSTAAVLEWVRQEQMNDCRVVIISSAAVYGDLGDEDANEQTALNPISPYGYHKVLAETLCEMYNRFYGVKISVVRLFSVYGEGLRKQLLWDALNKYKMGEYHFMGTGNELRDWIHVEDSARLLSAAAMSEQKSMEVYNGANEKSTIKSVLTQLALKLSTEGKPVFSGEVHNGNPPRLTSNSQYAFLALNWHPRISLNEGLARYVKWFKSN